MSPSVQCDRAGEGLRGAAMERPGIERKLTAILYADVAGYSRLTGADEEGTHRTLSAYLDAMTSFIESHGGQVVHTNVAEAIRTFEASAGASRGPEK